MSYYPQFGALLNQYLTEADRSPAWLARRLEMNDSTVSRWLNDGARPGSPETVARIADVLGITAHCDRLLVAAGYGYQGRDPDHFVRTPVSPAFGDDSVAAAAPPPGIMELLERAESQPPRRFVGRSRELAELTGALELARAGAGQIRFVIGGAGEGKSTLVQEFAQRAQEASADLLVISGYCNAHSGIGDPYLPFRQALDLLCGEVEAKLAGGGLSAVQAHSLWKALPNTLPALIEHAPDLIGTFVPGPALLERGATVAPPAASWLKRLETLVTGERGVPLDETRILAQYTAVLKAVASRHPLLFVVEDLQWLDISSAGLFFHLCQALGESHVLLVGTYRPDELMLGQGEIPHPLIEMTGELKRRHGDIWIDLGNPRPGEGRHFVDAYLDTQPNRLDEAFRAALFRHTQGHALFTVELLRDMPERGDLRQDESGYWVEGERVDWQSLPTKVEGVIEKRINHLDATTQSMLRVASVEGETFTAEVVARVQQVDERSVVQQLSGVLGRRHRLVAAQSLESLGRQRLSRYRFSHYLMQQYVYHFLDDMERAYLHEAVGAALEAVYGAEKAQVAVQLAHHYVQAGLTEKAVDALFLAGQQAHQLAAYREAIQHLRKALALLQPLSDTTQRARQELNIQLALGIALTNVSATSSFELETIFRRALELGQQLGETLAIWRAMWGLGSVYCAREEHQLAREYAEQVLSLSQELQDPEPRLEGHRLLGVTLHNLGEFSASRIQLKQVLEFYHLQRERNLLSPNRGAYPRIMALAFLAVNAWVLGCPDEALNYSQESLAAAEETAYPSNLAMGLHLSAWLHELRREGERVHTQGLAALHVATDYHLSVWLSHAIIDEGWAWVDQGRVEAGIARIRQGMAELSAIDQPMATPYFSTLLAKGYAASGQSEAGLEVVDNALADVERTEQRWCEAELHRLRGELLRMQDGCDAVAERCFWQAIDLAREQHAKSWELRATMSLCRLWQARDKQREACDLLAEIYGWFTEGFDTPDLIDARALLADLVHSGGSDR